MKPIDILLVEDHAVVREGFRKILELEKDFRTVGEACDGRQAVNLAKRLRPSIILMDIAMPKLNGLEATRQILHSSPTAKVIILSAYSDDAYVKNAVKAGARGFVLKQTTAHDLCYAIRQVDHGKTFFSSALVRRREHFSGQLKTSATSSCGNTIPLTLREMEVLQLIAEGNPNKKIAADLEVGMKTVEKHRENLMRKLDIHDTASLTRYAMNSGIIESNISLKIN